jgi:hypothetical protein
MTTDEQNRQKWELVKTLIAEEFEVDNTVDGTAVDGNMSTDNWSLIAWNLRPVELQ